MKDRFRLLMTAIERPGIDKLLEWLDKSDFYSAPASSRFHGSVEGGLLQHSLVVLDCLIKLTETFPVDVPMESKIITALFHDLAKVNMYKPGFRNVKNEETGKWDKVPTYTIEDSLPIGHGSKSVILLQAFIRPTVDEIMAITHHMGAWGAEGYTGQQTLSAAMNKYPLVLALQVADQMATFWDKK